MTARNPWVGLLTLVLFLLLSGGCDPDGADLQEEPEAGAEAPPPELSVPSGDPFAWGYTEEDFPRVQELAEGVYSYEQIAGFGDQVYVTVSFFVVTPEGVLVADGQGSVEETELLIRTIAEITDQPITHLVIGSDHGDHTAGNSTFPEGIEILAHPNSERNLRAQADSPDRPADAPPVVLPTRLVEEEEVLRLGGREIRVLFLGRAHTGGDLVVHLPEERILFLSEVFLARMFPAMRTAHPSEWLEALERVWALENVDIYVPGHGLVASPEVLERDLAAYHDALERVIAEVSRLHGEGLTVEEALEAAEFGELVEWSLAEGQGPIAVRQVYRELDGELDG